MTLEEIYLEARNPAIGCARAYHLTLSRDLFGIYMVQTRYGRIGTYGHAITRSFNDEGQARGFMQICLKRRKSAPGRIGVEYVRH